MDLKTSHATANAKQPKGGCSLSRIESAYGGCLEVLTGIQSTRIAFLKFSPHGLFLSLSRVSLRRLSQSPDRNSIYEDCFPEIQSMWTVSSLSRVSLRRLSRNPDRNSIHEDCFPKVQSTWAVSFHWVESAYGGCLDVLTGIQSTRIAFLRFSPRGLFLHWVESAYGGCLEVLTGIQSTRIAFLRFSPHGLFSFTK